MRDTPEPPTSEPRSPLHAHRGVQWVIKLSKLCNLRCQYCYEFPWLADSRRMELTQLDAFFRHVSEFYADTPRRMDFVWHGGEPLLHEPSYYEAIQRLERTALEPSGIRYTNSIQTNLYSLRRGTIELLRDSFDNVGVSVDLFGDLRKTANGRPTQERVLRNMESLLDAGVRFGCITVLSAPTAKYVDSIFQFFTELGVAFRLLPIYRTGFANQHDKFGLGDHEVVTALNRVADLWFEMEGWLQVRPIQDYVTNVIRKYAGGAVPQDVYDGADGEALFIIDTDGGVYSNADAYDVRFCYGNIFEQSLSELLRSAAYRRAVAARKQRMRLTCSTCSFHGACSGFFMGEATPEQRYLDSLGALKCGVALPVQRYIERKLFDQGLIDPVRLTLDRSRLPSMVALPGDHEALEF